MNKYALVIEDDEGFNVEFFTFLATAQSYKKYAESKGMLAEIYTKEDDADEE